MAFSVGFHKSLDIAFCESLALKRRLFEAAPRVMRGLVLASGSCEGRFFEVAPYRLQSKGIASFHG
jgi:hypothetical protein